MPEGPEIRRAADAVESILKGRIDSEVWFGLPRLQPFAATLTGQRVLRIDTHGKAMLTRFDNGLTLYSHNQLYGRWHCVQRGERPETRRQLRLRISTESHDALLYSASEIDVLNDQELLSHPFLSRLGPDLLAPTLDVKTVLAQLESRQFRNRRLGSILTDQGFLAGIGNYLRCEILFHAALHPTSKPSQCRPEQLARLAAAIIHLPRQSYETGGITNDLERAEQLMAAGSNFESARFQLFRREGLACYRCSSRIVKINQGGQPCYLCPNCQTAV